MSAYVDLPDVASESEGPAELDWDDLPQVSSDDEKEAPPRSTALEQAQEKADAMMKVTRPRTSTDPKTMQATRRRAQMRLVSTAKASGKDALIESALQFGAGQRAYPKLYALSRSAVPFETQLMDNCRSLVASTGRHARAHSVKQLTDGVPSGFARKRLGLSVAGLKSARESRSSNGGRLEVRRD
jgi:hypothetical protein